MFLLVFVGFHTYDDEHDAPAPCASCGVPYNSFMAPASPQACIGILAWLLALTAVGCSRPAEQTEVEFFPLHTEDTWVYEVSRPLRNQSTRMTVRVRGERYVSALQRRCRLVEESYAAGSGEGLSANGSDVPARRPPGPGEMYPIAYYSEKGFLYRALSLEYAGGELREIGIGSHEERFLPNHFTETSAWESVTTAYDLGAGNGYVVRQTHNAASEPGVVEVPAGRFTGCIRVDTVAVHSSQRDGRDEAKPLVLYYSDWYAPRVGLVRTIQSEHPAGSVPLTQIELLAYDVEGAER